MTFQVATRIDGRISTLLGLECESAAERVCIRRLPSRVIVIVTVIVTVTVIFN